MNVIGYKVYGLVIGVGTGGGGGGGGEGALSVLYIRYGEFIQDTSSGFPQTCLCSYK